MTQAERSGRRERPLRAYTVSSEENSVVVFAKYAVVARKQGAAELDFDLESIESCRRFPEMDQYAPGPVSSLVLLDHGWWFTCRGCECQITSDCEAFDANDEPRRLNPIEIGQSIYCTAECHDRYVADRAAREACQDAAIIDVQNRLLDRFPDIVLVSENHSYATMIDDVYVPQQVWISVSFPGAKYRNHFRFDKVGEEPRMCICQGDLEAWYAYVASITSRGT